ncbi:MAG: hypothetical protein JXA18_11570 [Chitinispirillaceae bacterium]|nr:hypothetical protein [Chitinispirillaceae bacterium]
MNVARFLSVAAIALFALVFGDGCAGLRSKVALPIEEIERPLSLPPRSVRLGIDGSAYVNSDDYDKKSDTRQPLTVCRLFDIGDKGEFYLPAIFRYNLLKNTEIRNNEVCITGTNAAVTAGLRGLNYYRSTGYLLLFGASLNYKRPLNERVWLMADCFLECETDTNLYGGSVQAGIGYQISRRFYATFVPSYSIYNPSFNDGYLISFPEIGRYFTLPLLLGVNMTKNLSLYWQSSIIYFRNYTVRYGQRGGIHFTW